MVVPTSDRFSLKRTLILNSDRVVLIEEEKHPTSGRVLVWRQIGRQLPDVFFTEKIVVARH